MRSRFGGVLEVAWTFLRLGLISFGGPVAHLGYVREACVVRRRWMDDAAYSDLVALCQFLPGPASSQVVFAMGMHRAGWLGAVAASVCFTLPSAVLMIGFGCGLGALDGARGAGYLHGLKIAAVAVVMQAVWGMGRNLCPDRTRLTIAAAAAGLLLVSHSGAMAQLVVICGGGMVGWWRYRSTIPVVEAPAPADWRHHVIAGGALAAFLLLLGLLPALAAATGLRELAVFDGFYRSGALVFGGGHVILPLLRAEVVPNGWVADGVFMAGYGAAQALPGPLFTFAGFLGAAIHPGPLAWAGGLWCLIAIFLPGWLLIAGALPFWKQLRARTWAQAALRGGNAAVVGVLLAAFYQPVWVQGIRDGRDAVACLIAFGLLQGWRTPPWLVVILAAVAGQWALRRF